MNNPQQDIRHTLESYFDRLWPICRSIDRLKLSGTSTMALFDRGCVEMETRASAAASATRTFS